MVRVELLSGAMFMVFSMVKFRFRVLEGSAQIKERIEKKMSRSRMADLIVVTTSDQSCQGLLDETNIGFSMPVVTILIDCVYYLVSLRLSRR